MYHDERSDTWIGCIGFKPGHFFYQKSFARIGNTPMYHYHFEEMSKSRHKNRRLWYLGFTLPTYSEIKVLDLLKKTVDKL